jgi:hypothetical protein
MICKGDRITFKPEWRDAGDESIEFRAIENEDGGRVKVMAMLGLSINPVSVIRTEWTEQK